MHAERKPVDVLHTPTPWAVGFSDGTGETYITAGDHPALKNACESIAVVVSGGTDDWGVTHGVRNPADARRIVACVNACAGLSTEALEGAAVAALMREVDIVADALTQDGRGPAGMTKEVAAKRLRAALARCGAQS